MKFYSIPVSVVAVWILGTLLWFFLRHNYPWLPADLAPYFLAVVVVTSIYVGLLVAVYCLDDVGFTPIFIFLTLVYLAILAGIIGNLLSMPKSPFGP